jgi:hypothetical protein
METAKTSGSGGFNAPGWDITIIDKKINKPMGNSYDS